MKHIHDALSIFIQEECDQRLPLPSGKPDLKAIAQSASLNDTIALLKLVVIAAINCADRIGYLQKIQTLSESTQEVLMTTAQEASEMEEARDEAEETFQDPRSAAEVSHALSQPRASGNRDLESEERLGKVIADNQRIAHEKRDLETKLDDLQNRYSRLRANQEATLEELRQTNERLTSILSGTADQNSSSPHQTTIIVTLEERLAIVDSELEELRKTNEVLKIKNDKVQKLQDDLDELRIDRDKLSRKANAADKYKQKLEAINDIEKENTQLRERVTELQIQLKQSDSSQVSSSDLAREIDEYRRLLPSIEQERHELNEMKKRLEFDYHTLEARYQETADQYSRQQKTMEEVQSRLRDYEHGFTPTPGTPKPVETEAFRGSYQDFGINEAELTIALLHEDTDADDRISEQELQAIISALRAQSQADAVSQKDIGNQVERKLFSALQRTQERQKNLRRHVEMQGNLILELRKAREDDGSFTTDPMPLPVSLQHPKASKPHVAGTEQTGLAEQLEEAEELNKSLSREIKLITSAWYNQHMRMLNSGLSFPRAGRRDLDGPQSFLGKQRKIVDRVLFGP